MEVIFRGLMGRWRDVARGFPMRVFFFSSSLEDRAKRHEAPAALSVAPVGFPSNFPSDDTPTAAA